MKNKDTVKKFFKILISFLLMVLLFRTINIDEIKLIIGQISIGTVALAVLIYFISIILNAVKWRFLLKNTKLSYLVFLCFRAQLYSVVLPGQLFGEASKIATWKDKEEDTTRVAASVVFDKITGIVGQMMLAVAGICFSTLAGVSQIKYWLIAIAIMILVIMWFSSERHVARIINNIIWMINDKNEKIGSKVQELYDSWCFFSSNKNIVVVSVVWGVINQFMGNIMIYLISQKLMLDVSFIEYCWINPMMSLILLIPISFAGIGLRDASLASMLSLFEVPTSKSIMISSILLFSQVMAALVGGIMLFISNAREKNEK